MLRKKSNMRVTLFIICLFGANLLGGCFSQSKTETEPFVNTEIPHETSEAYQEASQLFVTFRCISCHGSELQGRVGEASNLQKVGLRRTVDEIKDKIRQGGNGMPSFSAKLSDEQITLLAEWLHTKQ